MTMPYLCPVPNDLPIAPEGVGGVDASMNMQAVALQHRYGRSGHERDSLGKAIMHVDSLLSVLQFRIAWDELSRDNDASSGVEVGTLPPKVLSFVC